MIKIKYKINVKSWLYNGIIEEIENLESNENISFNDLKNRSRFIDDLLSEMIEQYENNVAYYGSYYPDFAGSVADKLKYDSYYYNISIIE